MKLAIVPALALAAGSVALMASPASASPEVGQQSRAANPAKATADAKWYGGHKDDYQDHNHFGDVCNIYQFFPGTNIASGITTLPVNTVTNVVTQTANFLGINLEANTTIDNGCP